jgi:hypothetical protein
MEKKEESESFELLRKEENPRLGSALLIRKPKQRGGESRTPWGSVWRWCHSPATGFSDEKGEWRGSRVCQPAGEKIPDPDSTGFYFRIFPLGSEIAY